MILIHSISAALLFALAHPLLAAPAEQTALTQPGSFGTTVALAGDTLVVGAPKATVAGVSAGSVYVYVRNGASWTQQVVLTASNPDAGDLFGEAVAISGDRIVVGAPEERSGSTDTQANQADNSTPLAGAVYVFQRSGITWTQQAYIKAPNTKARMRFGSSVALSGNTLAVGSSNLKRYWYGVDTGFVTFETGDSSNATGVDGDMNNTADLGAGAVFVYHPSGNRWCLEAYLKASNTNKDDYFGFSVALDGNLLVVGAPGESSAATGVNGNQADNSLPWAGAAYVFARDTNGFWAQQAYLKADVQDIGVGAGTGIGFGHSVAISGSTVAVGFGGGDDGWPDGGKVWVFTGSPAGAWSQQQVLTPLLAGSYFGYSLGLSGDTLVVGECLLRDPWILSPHRPGDAHVFTRAGGNWTRQAAINPSSPLANVGFSVAIDGGTFAVGTGEMQWDYTAANQAWVFTGAGLSNIAVEQPAGMALASGSNRTIGAVPGTPTDTLFTIRNTGPEALTLTGSSNLVALSGSSDFSITAQPTATVSPGGSATFTVRFAPATAGLKTATLTIPNDDPDTSPYTINLTGRGLSFTTDTDGDGMSDAAEFQLASLGFDWQSGQPALVTNYFANANNNGLYTTSQVQALHVGTPLLQRNATTGKFTLTIGVKKTSVLGQPFADFPFDTVGTTTTINGAGKVEFEFPASGNAAFFRLESQ